MDTIDTLFKDVDDATIKPPLFILEDFIPTGLTIIGGPPKLANKSIISMACAALVSERDSKVLPPWVKLRRDYGGPVQCWSFEADAGELKEMLQTGMNIKPTYDRSIIVAENPEDFQLDDEDNIHKLIMWMIERNPRLVIIDPFRDMHTMEENDSAVVAKILQPLRKWAHAADSAVILVHHTTKPQEGMQRHRAHNLRGSGAVFGKADAVLMSEPHGNKEGVVSIQATFKRGKKWERNISLGCPGFGWSSIGHEVLDQTTLKIMEAADKYGIWDLKAISAITKEPHSNVRQAYDAAIRNNIQIAAQSATIEAA